MHRSFVRSFSPSPALARSALDAPRSFDAFIRVYIIHSRLTFRLPPTSPPTFAMFRRAVSRALCAASTSSSSSHPSSSVVSRARPIAGDVRRAFASRAARFVDVDDDALLRTLPEHASVRGLKHEFDFTRDDVLVTKEERAKTRATTAKRLLTRSIDDALMNAIAVGKRIDVRGSRGVGKSVALAKFVMRAREEGVVACYVPDGLELTRRSYFSKSANEEGIWESPDCAMRFLKHVANVANERTLSAIDVDQESMKELAAALAKKKTSALKKTKGGDGGDGAMGDATASADGKVNLFQFATIASTEPTLAIDCAIKVIDELMTLAKTGNAKVVFVVDQYNSLFGPSDMFEVTGPRSRSNIPAQKLRFARALTKAVESSMAPDAKHVSVTAASQTIGVSDAVTAASRPDPSVNGVVVIECPKYTREEIDVMLREYKRVGVLRSDIDAKIVDEMKSLTNGNPREIQAVACAILR